jgi:hypothetical protein
VITTFDAPGAGSTGWLSTLLRTPNIPTQGTGSFGIDTAGTAVGSYADPSVVYHGYSRISAGTITTFDAPGAGTGAGQGTIGLSINTAGNITGSYLDAGNVLHGFVRTP